MGDLDALLWAVERDPRLASTVGSVSLFSPPIDPDALRVRLERTTRVVPRLRQRVVGNPLSLAPPRWEFDPEFDLDNHLDVIACDGDGSLRDVLDMAAPILAAPFDRERPLFSFTLITNVENDQSALIMRAHHAIADGLGMLQIQVELFDFEPNTPDPVEMPEIPTGPLLTPGERVSNAVQFERARTNDAIDELKSSLFSLVADGPIAGFDRLVDTLGSGLRSMQPVTPLSPVLVERSTETHLATVALSLAELRARGKQAGTRMNAVFVAGVARGMGLFHEQIDAEVTRLRMGMPVSKRSDGDSEASGNFFAPVRVELPVTADSPVALIQIVDALVESHRDEPALDVLGPAANLLSRLPRSAGGALFGAVLAGTDFLTSNVPGSPVPIHVGPSTMLAQYPFGPTNAAAVNVTLLSYGPDVHIGVSVDSAATDQAALLGTCIADGFNWVLS